MIKIIIPVEEDVLDGIATLLKMSCKPSERDTVNTVLAKIKQDGTAEVSPNVINGDEATEALAARAMKRLVHRRRGTESCVFGRSAAARATERLVHRRRGTETNVFMRNAAATATEWYFHRRRGRETSVFG